MPGTLEREAAGLKRELAAIDEARRLVVARAEEVAADLLAEAQRIIPEWRRLCVAVAKGETARVHALRGKIEKEAEECLAGLDALAGVARAEEIRTAREAVSGFATAVFPRWQTPDDLEELAVEWFPLSGERLLRMTKEPVPQAWYDQDAPQP